MNQFSLNGVGVKYYLVLKNDLEPIVTAELCRKLNEKQSAIELNDLAWETCNQAIFSPVVFARMWTPAGKLSPKGG